MSHPPRPTQELLCINAEKVYDWVILQNTIRQFVSAEELGLDHELNDVKHVSTRFILTDEHGKPLGPNAEVKVKEIDRREEKTFVIDGALVTLEKVSFVKIFYVVIEFRGTREHCPFVFTSHPIQVEVHESLFLCAPEGTRLVVRITDLDGNAKVNFHDDCLKSVDLSLTTCQSIQAVADVTIEVKADFCQPRDILTEQCSAPIIPQQCPVLFPGHDH
ncbi:hypothetical protein ACIQD3_16595 [Peribacillus loiseleuriae]|uniref:hypothetical protein n=1 Tax=Peribacillus loiseleuriae TaxID=1679170 RepID=UPI0038113AF1